MEQKAANVSELYDNIQGKHELLLAHDLNLSATTIISAVLEVAAIANTKDAHNRINGIYTNCASLLVPYIEARDDLICMINDAIKYEKMKSGELVLAYSKFFPDRMVPVLEEQVLTNAPEALKGVYVFEFNGNSNALSELRAYLEERRACARNNLKALVANETSLIYGLWVQYQKRIVLERESNLSALIKTRVFDSEEEMEQWLGDVLEASMSIDYELKELTAIGSGVAEEIVNSLKPLKRRTKSRVESVVKHLVNTGYWENANK